MTDRSVIDITSASSRRRRDSVAGQPRVPRTQVLRGRLIDSIEAGTGRGLVILSAPAGSGKTLALASWCAQRSAPVAWMSVQPEDEDPERFWAHVLRSLQSTPGLPSGSILRTLQSPPSFDHHFVSQVLEACDALPGARTLVIDDLHQLTGTAAMASLVPAVRRGLGSLRLVISTRADLPLPLQRLRLVDELTEIRASDLAFTEAEARTLFETHGVTLTDEQLAVLLHKTEGWAAGLRLAALSLGSSEDLETSVRELAGEQRTVADYLVEEVLDQLSPELTDFLLSTCVVREMTVGLVNALTGRDDGLRMVSELERENLFIVALDDRRRRYRYHHLFGDLLRHRLATLDPQRERVLNRKAADWYAAHGHALDAGLYLAKAEDWDALARSVVRSSGAQMFGVDRAALATVITTAVNASPCETPELATAGAIACYARTEGPGMAAHVARGTSLLGMLEPRDREVTEAVLAALAAQSAWIASDGNAMVRDGSHSLDLLGRITVGELPALPTYTLATRVVLAVGQLWTGRLDEAERGLAQAASALQDDPLSGLVLAIHLHGHLAVLHALRGRLEQAAGEADRTLDAAERSGWLFLPQAAPAFLAQSIVHLQRGEHERCQEAIVRGESCVGDLPDLFIQAALQLVRTGLELARGDLRMAASVLDVVDRELSRWAQAPDLLRDWARQEAAELLLARGAPAEAQPLLTVCPEPPGVDPARAGPGRALLLARCALELNEPDACLAQVAALGPAIELDRVAAVERSLLVALASDRLRRDADASAALFEALDLSSADGIVRPFLVMGPHVRLLVQRHERAFAARPPHLEVLFDAPVAHHSPSGNVDLALTDREQAVLFLLPTMMTNAEIALELYVSVNTVKVHLKSLYRKLDSTSRRAAVRRARELGVLDAVSLRAHG